MAWDRWVAGGVPRMSEGLPRVAVGVQRVAVEGPQGGQDCLQDGLWGPQGGRAAFRILANVPAVAVGVPR